MPALDQAGMFRLRAFESDWVLPLVDPTDELDSLLLAEARLWIDIGCSLGYFAGAATRLTDDVDVPERFASRLKPARHEWSDLPPALFQQRLVEAQSDLTRDRQEYLRLLLFADTDDWERALESLDRVTGALRPGTQLRREVVDDIAWALEGAESDLDARHQSLPASWRSVSAPVLDEARAGQLASRRRALAEQFEHYAQAAAPTSTEAQKPAADPSEPLATLGSLIEQIELVGPYPGTVTLPAPADPPRPRPRLRPFADLAAKVRAAARRGTGWRDLPLAPSFPRPPRSGGWDQIETLKRLADLRDQGILTEKEFEQAKRDALNRP
jgi:hypothetical protein